MKRFLAILLGLSFIFLTGCTKAPVEKIDAAKAALEAVRNNPDSDTFAPDTLKAAEDKAAALDQELTVQKNKFFKDYKATEKLVNELSDLAAKAKKETTEAKTAAKNEAEMSIVAAEASLNEAREAIKTTPTGRRITIDITTLNTELTTAAAQVQQAKLDLIDLKYSDVKARATIAKEKADKVKADIQAAIDSISNKNTKKK